MLYPLIWACFHFTFPDCKYKFKLSARIWEIFDAVVHANCTLCFQACLEVDQVTCSAGTVRFLHIVELLEIGAVLTQRIRPSFANRMSQAMEIVLQPILHCALTLSVLENFKSVYESVTDLAAV